MESVKGEWADMPADLNGCCECDRKAGAAMAAVVMDLVVVAFGETVVASDGGNGLARFDVNAVALNEDLTGLLELGLNVELCSPFMLCGAWTLSCCLRQYGTRKVEALI
jgi:hypothetical protein